MVGFRSTVGRNVNALLEAELQKAFHAEGFILR